MSVPRPVNTTEEYLHAMTMRLDALCNMMDSLIKHIAEKEGIATMNVTDKEVKEVWEGCQAKTKSGANCRGMVTKGEKYCSVHSKKVK